MSERWATLIQQDDGTEVVSTIAQMEGYKPDIRNDGGKYRVVKVKEGVKIGDVIKPAAKKPAE